MAPPRLYELPLQQLERLLREARVRGLSFERAWEEAVRPGKIVMSNTPKAPATALRWPTDRTDRLAWQHAINSTREGWRRAYECDPLKPRERALCTLGEAFSALDEDALRMMVMQPPTGVGAPAAVVAA